MGRRVLSYHHPLMKYIYAPAPPVNAQLRNSFWSPPRGPYTRDISAPSRTGRSVRLVFRAPKHPHSGHQMASNIFNGHFLHQSGRWGLTALRIFQGQSAIELGREHGQIVDHRCWMIHNVYTRGNNGSIMHIRWRATKHICLNNPINGPGLAHLVSTSDVNQCG